MSATIEIRAILRDEFEASARRMISELTAIGSAGSSAGASLRMGMSSALPTVEAVNESLGRNNAQLRAQIAAYKSPEGAQYLAQQKKLREEIDDLTRSGNNNALTWANMASKYYLVSQALGHVASSTMAVVEATSKYELIEKRLSAVEGSDAGGRRDRADVQNLAKAPGLSFETAANTMATLRSMSVSAKEAKDLISGIANANTSAAGTAEQFGNVMYQIQQSISLGRLMQEDLRPILQQIPTLGAAIRKEFGSSTAEELNKVMEKNGMTIQGFWSKVAEIGQKMPATGETIANNLDNLGDAWTRFKASLGNTDAIRGATGALADLIDQMARASEGGGSKAELGVENAEKEIARIKNELSAPDVSTWKRMNLQAELKDAELSRLEWARQLIAVKSGQEGAGSMAGYRGESLVVSQVKERTAAQIKAEEEAAKKIAAFRDKMDDMEIERVNRRNAELVEHRAALAAKMGTGERWSDSRMKEDKAADDKYWDDQDKALADWKKTFNASQKQKFAAYKENEDAITKAEEKEWDRRSRLAVSYADTLSSTLNNAYTDMWVNGRDTFDALYDAFSEMITKMALEMAAKATIFGIFSAFGGGGLLGGASSYIFGARASGGAMFPGVQYRYNEDPYNGRGGEIFRPSVAGTSSPNRAGNEGGGDTLHFHFAAGTSRADAGHIVRSIQRATKGRQRSVSLAL